MKFFILMTTLAWTAQFSAAEELTLNQESLVGNSSKVTLVRTNLTPKKVFVNLPYQAVSSQCAEMGEREVNKQDPRCGQRIEYRHECRPESICRKESKPCPDPDPNEPYDIFKRPCIGYYDSEWCDHFERCADFPYSVNLTCAVKEEYCLKFEDIISTQRKTATIKFKDMVRLKTPNDLETFALEISQDNKNGPGIFALDIVSTKANYKLSWDAKDGEFEVKRK
jgi:hypothetical protein